MSSQRYQQVAGHDENEVAPIDPSHIDPSHITPSSPPPSFRSRVSSPSRSHLLSHDPLSPQADQALADSFDNPSDDDASESGDEAGGDDRQSLMHQSNTRTESFPDQQPVTVGGDVRGGQDGERPYVTRRPPAAAQRRMTELPRTAHTPPIGSTGPVYGGGSTSANDGVFANLDAKPERGEKTEEQPPSYEQAAADATPPYWETTILAPGVGPDEVFIDGLPVGSVFSFVWNGMISMSFQLVGFLLTYLLHTTHAAKNGSKAGLGITLVQYGFYMKGSRPGAGEGGASGDSPYNGQPPDPNSHDFDPTTVAGSNAAVAVAAMADASNGNSSPASRAALSGITTGDWLAYLLMIVGWFLLIRAVSNFLKARRHEQLVLQSPDRGLNLPIVATGEQAETVV